MRSIAVTGIKDLTLSADGREASFALVTKYAGELTVTLPAECLKDLQAPGGRAAPAAPAAGARSGNGKAADGNLTVTVPKKWFVAGDAQRALVVVGLDPRTPTQSGFALGPKAAKELAAALAKQADALAAGKAGEAGKGA